MSYCEERYGTKRWHARRARDPAVSFQGASERNLKR